LWRELAELNQLAVRCADRCVDLAGLAHSHRGLARAYLRLGWLAEAEEQLAQAHRLYAELDDQVSLARVQLNLAVLREEQGRLPDALTHAQSAYALFAASPRRCEQAAALNAIGWYQAGLGEDESAIDSCEQALELHRLVGSRFGEATTWDSLGYVRHRLGQYDDALRCYRRAADLIRVLGVSHLEADVLRRIAQTCEVAGYRGAARQAWHQAYVILSQLNHPDADALADRIEALDTGHPIPAGSTAD
jgi:tetratricopeptide (TPR) repeat protein